MKAEISYIRLPGLTFSFFSSRRFHKIVCQAFGCAYRAAMYWIVVMIESPRARYPSTIASTHNIHLPGFHPSGAEIKHSFQFPSVPMISETEPAWRARNEPQPAPSGYINIMEGWPSLMIHTNLLVVSINTYRMHPPPALRYPEPSRLVTNCFLSTMDRTSEAPKLLVMLTDLCGATAVHPVQAPRITNTLPHPFPADPALGSGTARATHLGAYRSNSGNASRPVHFGTRRAAAAGPRRSMANRTTTTVPVATMSTNTIAPVRNRVEAEATLLINRAAAVLRSNAGTAQTNGATMQTTGPSIQSNEAITQSNGAPMQSNEAAKQSNEATMQSNGATVQSSEDNERDAKNEQPGPDSRIRRAVSD